jgi:hypothetical protein
VEVVGMMVVLAALVIGVVPQFTHCKAVSASSGSTMSMGSSTTMSDSSTATGGATTMGAGTAATQPTPMRCYWTARAAIGVALPLAAAGVLLFFSRRKETCRALAILVCVLGVVTVLLPTVLIGTCQPSSTVCNTTMRPILLATGGLTILIGLITLVRNELTAEEHTAAMQAAS